MHSRIPWLGLALAFSFVTRAQSEGPTSLFAGSLIPPFSSPAFTSTSTSESDTDSSSTSTNTSSATPPSESLPFPSNLTIPTTNINITNASPPFPFNTSTYDFGNTSNDGPSPGIIAAIASCTTLAVVFFAFLSYYCCCRRHPRRAPLLFHPKASSSTSIALSAPPKHTPPLDAEQGRADLESEVEDLRRKVARLEAERIAAGLPPSLDDSAAARAYVLGEKDEAAARAYTAGLATMGELKGDGVRDPPRHNRARSEMGPPPPRYEG
ncbi:hypothetical protein C8J57DRAFT_205521 [Mycena rebaudengoi]|nr:hypothetical protein C8J57DRAFT_205521 [Mycena rebaudengoi]